MRRPDYIDGLLLAIGLMAGISLAAFLGSVPVLGAAAGTVGVAAVAYALFVVGANLGKYSNGG